ncbi:MAG: hypothetical protein ACT4P3_13745 [Betaproteobacteria bacterium]
MVMTGWRPCMRSLSLALPLAAALACSPTWAEDAARPSAAFTGDADAFIRAQNYVALQERVEQDCATHVSRASSGKSADMRAEAALDAVRCVRSRRAYIAARDTAPGSTIRIRMALEAQEATALRLYEVRKADAEFLGLNWGLGFGFSFGSSDAVDDAEVVNGIVRVKSQKKQQPRVLFEFHKYFWCHGDAVEVKKGCGPFVAVAASQDKAVSGIGIGFMYGEKRKPADSDGFSLGVGAILDGKVKDLAEGFRRDQPLPAGETAVRFEEKARWSLLLFVTRTF